MSDVSVGVGETKDRKDDSLINLGGSGRDVVCGGETGWREMNENV